MTEHRAPYELVEREVLADGILVTFNRDRVAMPGGEVATRDVATCTPSVAVVPLMADGTVVMVHQYRHAIGRRLLELPAGLLDMEGEDPVEAARRELAEEVGLAADELVQLVHMHCSAGWTDEHTRVYLATGLREVPRPADFVLEHEEADMEVVRLPLDEAVDAVASGTITDGKTVAGLLAAQRHVATP